MGSKFLKISHTLERSRANVLDAFLLGKALAEAVNGWIGIVVGEILRQSSKSKTWTFKKTLEMARIARDKVACEALGKENGKETSASNAVSAESSPASDSAASPIEHTHPRIRATIFKTAFSITTKHSAIYFYFLTSRCES